MLDTSIGSVASAPRVLLGLCINVTYTLRFTDPIANEHTQEIRRRVLCNLGVCRSLLADGTPTEEHNA